MNGLKRLTLLSKTAAVQKLVPRALWWFRWVALITFLAGAITLVSKGMHAGAGWIAIYSSSWGIMILTGSALGTLMFLNVWVVIWPNQKVVIASTNQVAVIFNSDVTLHGNCIALS